MSDLGGSKPTEKVILDISKNEQTREKALKSIVDWKVDRTHVRDLLKEKPRTRLIEILRALLVQNQEVEWTDDELKNKSDTLLINKIMHLIDISTK